MGRFCRSLVGFVAAARVFGEYPDSIRLNNGLMMPVVSLGTAGFNDSFVEYVVQMAVGAGFVGIDTAFNYYNQVGIGRALQKFNRSKVFITTKTSPCQHAQADPKYNITDVALCKVQTRKDIESNFRQLNVNFVDLLLLHGANHYGAGPCTALASQLDTAQWEVYQEYYNAGKARAIGVSNFCASCIDSLLTTSTIRPAINQIKYHPGMTADPDGLLSYCVGRAIWPMAYSPMGGAGELFDNPVLQRIASVYGKTPPQIALKWIASKGYALATKSSSAEHLREDLDLFSWKLAADDLNELDAMSGSTDVPSWSCTAANLATLTV